MTALTIEYDVPVSMRDGIVLQADVYRPEGEGPRHVIVVPGPEAPETAVDDAVSDRAGADAPPPPLSEKSELVTVGCRKSRSLTDGGVTAIIRDVPLRETLCHLLAQRVVGGPLPTGTGVGVDGPR